MYYYYYIKDKTIPEIKQLKLCFVKCARVSILSVETDDEEPTRVGRKLGNNWTKTYFISSIIFYICNLYQ